MKTFKFLILIILNILILQVYNNFAEDVLRPKSEKESGLMSGGCSGNKILIGIEGGLNFNFFSQNISWFPPVSPNNIPTTFNSLDDGSGISPHFGVMLDFPINRKFGIQIRGSYDIKKFENEGMGYDYDQSGNQVNMGIAWNVTNNYLTVTALLRYDITNAIFLTVGPTFHFLLGDTKAKIAASTAFGDVAPEYTLFYPLIQSSFDKAAVSTRFGMEAGLGYKIQLGIFALVPQVRYQLMLSKAFEDYTFYNLQNPQQIYTAFDKRSLNSIQLVLGLWCNL